MKFTFIPHIESHAFGSVFTAFLHMSLPLTLTLYFVALSPMSTRRVSEDMGESGAFPQM
jgi:hypothetical protein